jgi:site-specific DNA-methyltransferase (adenine-specific)
MQHDACESHRQELPLDKIILGDNCEVMRMMPSQSIDLVVTSPPYDDLRTYGGHSWDFYGVAWNLKRLLKPGGVIVWIVADGVNDGDESGSSWEQARHFKSIGMKLHDTMIYQKTTFSKPCPNRYHDVWEYCFVLSNGGVKTFNPLMDRKNSNAGRKTSVTIRERDGSITRGYDRTVAEYGKRWNVWQCDSARNDRDNGDHPAPFPESLARDHILSWSNEGDVVLDPFSGSGTTAKMAKHNGRRFIGIEVNPEYVEISRERLAQGVLF